MDGISPMTQRPCDPNQLAKLIVDIARNRGAILSLTTTVIET